MVGGRKFFSESQRPEDGQNRSQPRQKASRLITLIDAPQPVSYAGERLAGKGKDRLGRVQTARPAAKGGGIG